jgi:hypothetical protein
MGGFVKSRVAALEQKIQQERDQNPVAALMADYDNIIRPAYVRRYGDIANIAPHIFVNEGDPHFNGDGGVGMVLMTLGVAREPVRSLRLFALAHETGHGVVCLESMRLTGSVINTLSDADTRWHEFMADLIGMRVLKDYLPVVAAEVMSNLGLLSARLGPAFGQHPSGLERTALIRKLYFGRSFGQLFAAVATKVLPA